MIDLNRATIMGNMTRDPELRYTPTNRQVISFTVATNRRWTSAVGEKQEQTEFHNVVAWGKLAEICNQILYKGRKVYVEGRLQTRSWEGQDGVKRQKTEIIADNVIAVGPPKGGTKEIEESMSEAMGAKETPKKKTEEVKKEPIKKKPTKEEKEEEEEIDLDDIPF